MKSIHHMEVSYLQCCNKAISHTHHFCSFVAASNYFTKPLNRESKKRIPPYHLRDRTFDAAPLMVITYDHLGEDRGDRMIDYVDIGERVKFFRLQNNLSQEQLAELSRLSRVHISCIERGERTPSLEAIINIANSLCISSDDLLAGNLIVSAHNSASQDFEILLDCSPEEIRIIKQTMICLKEALRG